MNGTTDAKGDALHELPPDHPASWNKLFVVEQRDGPDECTICPRGVAPDELLTTWLSAGRPWVIDLDAAR